MSDSSLKNKTVNGIGWSAADAILGQGITFLVGLILARRLTPDEYGLIGICLIFTTILNGIVDSGFSNAIIRKQEADNKDYNTMFITNMVVSIALFILLFFAAPWISTIFKRTELTPLIRAMGSILIINALSITQVTNLTKRIDFKTKTKASLVSAITSGAIGIGMVFSGFGVWALVAQQISKQAFYTFSLWIFNRWWPNFSFSISSFRYMWGFGWKLMLSGLLDNIWKQLYQVVVASCYSPASLGHYTRSREYAQLFSINLTSIVQRVSYPALAEIQDDKERMIAAYRKVIKVTMFVTCVCMISMGAVAEPLPYCLIGPQWHEAATYLPLICLSMSLYPLHAINLNMLQIQGRSDIFLYIEIIKKVIGILPLCIGIFVNIYWMLITSLFTGLIAFFLNSYYTGKKLGYTSWMQLKDIAPDYLVAFLMAIAVYFFKFLPLSNWIILPLQVVVGAAVMFIICETTKLSEYIEIKQIILSTIDKSHRK
ncbi:MAG: lipopolysaccharide biosynthesis protein [Bacteroidales bacterium]|nr:lipopolysaccharide biosynthesis protein [Bacteroidales bacterium]